MKPLTTQIKNALLSMGVANKVSTYGSTITVTALSPMTLAMVETIRAMETVKAHGDIMDDTRWYTGKSIQFRYEWEPTEEEQGTADVLLACWSDDSKTDRQSFAYHFTRQCIAELGPIGERLASERLRKLYTMGEK